MASSWTRDTIHKYGLQFDEADTDKSGNLKYREVVTVLVKSGFRGRDAEVKKIFRELDTNDDLSISRQEFLAAMEKMPDRDIKTMSMRQAFQAIDSDNSGYLSRAEVMNSVSNVELNADTEKISELILRICTEKDQRINYEEFLKVFSEQKDS